MSEQLLQDMVIHNRTLERENEHLRSMLPAQGTWTPAFSSTGATFAYTTQAGFWWYSGGLCYITGLIILNGTPGGTTSNALDITGLPFAQSTTTWMRGWLNVAMSLFNIGANKVPAAYIGPSSTAIHLMRQDVTGASWDFMLPNMVAAMGAEFDVSGFYVTA